MLTELRHARDCSPDQPAVRSSTPGGWADTTWTHLCDEAEAAAAQARMLRQDRPFVLIVDGTAASIATMAGLLGTGADVLLLEEQSSYLTDPRSPVHALGAQLIIGPAGLLGRPAAGYQVYEEFRAAGGPPAPAATAGGEVLQLTSGSTGEPRITRQRLANVLHGGRLYRRLFKMTERDVVLIAVPTAHSYGLAGLSCALHSVATMITIPHFSLRLLIESIQGGATAMLGTPLLYRLLTPVLAAQGPARLRIALSAGGPIPVEAVPGIAAALGTPVRQIYGTTEAGLIACVPAEVAAWPPGSVGFASPGVTLRPDAGSGRLFVRTPTMFEGYWGSGTPAVMADGFHDTGDLVRINPAGYVFVLGRKESVINVGGRKVSPQRIESIMLEHPGVRDVFVYGVERPDKEQEMHAAVVLGPATGIRDVLEFCRSRSLQPYEVPHRVHVLDRLPRTGMGKIDRERLLEATGRQDCGAA